MTRDLLPPNATKQERAISESLARLLDVPVVIRDLWNPHKCPSSHLAWLAWAMSVDVWSESWSEEQKRNIIADSVLIHRKKGTIGAIRNALNALGYDMQIIEWFEKTPSGPAYTFEIQVTVLNEWPQGRTSEISQVVQKTKNTRSHFLGIQLNVAVENEIPQLESITQAGALIEINPLFTTEVEASGDAPSVGAATQGFVIIEVEPLAA